MTDEDEANDLPDSGALRTVDHRCVPKRRFSVLTIHSGKGMNDNGLHT